jgi:alpha-tubulin suppressor-like RCC1 family protein
MLPHLLPNIKDVTNQVACGASHSVLLSDNGEVYTMGENSRGQLGTGSTSNKGVPNPRLVEELTFTKMV